MDKVITDGVDVSKCKHFGIDSMELCKINFDNNYFSNGIPCAEKCNKHPNCYYKQLQRAKAENEKLKNQYSFSTILKIDELKQENERLKEELDFLKNNTYREALREIREYINDNTDFDKGDYFQSKTAAYDILQIIALYGE